MSNPESTPKPTISIRPATPADEPAVSRICLLTGEAGTSAEKVYSIPDLIGLVYAVPYLHVPSGFAYLLVETTSSGEETAIGYIVGTVDTRKYVQETKDSWWPVQAEKYPIEELKDREGVTDGDRRLMGLFVKPDPYPNEIIDKVPAHMHINVLPQAQGTGWGRRLISTAIQHISREAGGDALFLGIDSRNDRARRFYLHVGFKRVETEQGENYVLKFEDWKGSSSKAAVVEGNESGVAEVGSVVAS